MLYRRIMRAGRLVKICIYTPSVSRGNEQTRQHRQAATKTAQRFINCRNQIERLSLILAGNFDVDNAVFITLTYDDNHLPTKKAAVKAHYEKFAREVRASLRLKGRSFGYARSIEGESTEDEPTAQNPCSIGYELKPWGDRQKWEKEGEPTREKNSAPAAADPVRFHCHIISTLSPSDYDTVRSLWPYGHAYISRIDTKDRESFPKLASYMTKDTRKGKTRVGERCFACSKGLARPVVSGEWIEADNEAVPAGAFEFEDSMDGTSRWSYCHRIGYIEPPQQLPTPAALPKNKRAARETQRRSQNKKRGKTPLLP